MKSKKLQITMFCLLVLATLCVSSNAKADTWNKSTKLTFSQPVEVSGIVLKQSPAAPSDDVEVAEVVDTVAIAEALPLLGLIGLLAVGAGLALRFITINEAAIYLLVTLLSFL
jgi:hypothetical protein